MCNLSCPVSDGAQIDATLHAHSLLHCISQRSSCVPRLMMLFIQRVCSRSNIIRAV